MSKIPDDNTPLHNTSIPRNPTAERRTGGEQIRDGENAKISTAERPNDGVSAIRQCSQCGRSPFPFFSISTHRLSSYLSRFRLQITCTAAPMLNARMYDAGSIKWFIKYRRDGADERRCFSISVSSSSRGQMASDRPPSPHARRVVINHVN